MKIRNFMLGFGALALSFGACKKDDKNDYTVPTSYNFANVDYSGQTARLSMLTELSAYLKTAHAENAPALDAQKLLDMYANANEPFADGGLNTSGKQLKDKTASAEQAKVEAWLQAAADASLHTSNTNPTPGNPGIIFKNDGSVGYLLNGNGLEWQQMIEKGLMGACFYYQATAVYLGSGKMEVDNATVTPGKGTDMEHHWDEAFGYLGLPTDYPSNTNGLLFWGKYAQARNAVLGSGANLMKALLTGRAAISNKDLERRDRMIDSVRREWEIVVVGTAVSYLNTAKAQFDTDAGVRHHALSEAYAFIYGLQFGGGASLTPAQVNSVLVLLADSADPLQANIYNTTLSKVEAAIDALAGYFPGINAVKNQL